MTSGLRRLVFLAGICVSSSAVSQTPVSSEIGTLKRELKVVAHEVFDERKLRVFLTVDEFDSEGRYLLNTLDAKSFKLFSKDGKEAPVVVSSLSTVATKSPAVHRETAIVFESSVELPESQSESIRKAVASFLGGFRSDVLSVRSGNEETAQRLAWISPEQSENPRAIQRAVLDADVAPGGRGLTPVVCSAVRDLTSLTGPARTVKVQRNVLIVSTDMNSTKRYYSELKQCLTDAANLGARIFWVRLKETYTEQTTEVPVSQFFRVLSESVKKSGGFIAHVGGAADPLPALNNLRSYLDDEYVLEFDLQNFKPHDESMELELTANYHGHALKSGTFKASGFKATPTPEELQRSAALKENSRRQERANVLMIAALLVLTGVVIWIRLKKKIHVCSSCTFVVARNFQDCPFRNSKCYGRLSVIHGPMLGKIYPLFSGENTLGRKRNSMIRLKGKGVSREHANIVLSKRKALFKPVKGSMSLVNGVPTTEPRLLGSGSVVRIGDSLCRVDFKEGE